MALRSAEIPGLSGLRVVVFVKGIAQTTGTVQADICHVPDKAFVVRVFVSVRESCPLTRRLIKRALTVSPCLYHGWRQRNILLGVKVLDYLPVNPCRAVVKYD